MKYPSLKAFAILLVIPVVVITTGCVPKADYDILQQNYDNLQRERDDLEVVTAEQDKELKALNRDYDELNRMFATEIEQNAIQLKKLVDGIEMDIPSDVMYESGSATASVGAEGLEYAKKLAGFLSGTDYFISVIGHTDSQQPTPRLAKKFPTNWDLAAARASNATKYLISQGCDSKNIVAVSRGEFDPVATNDTAEGRAQNRRIQIIIRELPD
jgi:chemotaxis protein MotB